MTKKKLDKDWCAIIMENSKHIEKLNNRVSELEAREREIIEHIGFFEVLFKEVLPTSFALATVPVVQIDHADLLEILEKNTDQHGKLLTARFRAIIDAQVDDLHPVNTLIRKHAIEQIK